MLAVCLAWTLATGALVAGAASQEGNAAVVPATLPSAELEHYLLERLELRQSAIDRARGGSEPAHAAGLPDELPADLIEAEAFVRVPVALGGLVIDESALNAVGLSAAIAFEDEEWARLPAAMTIRRDQSRGYEIWHFPAGARIAHRIYQRSPRRLFELRLVQKLEDDDAIGTGRWAYGVYRPVRGSAALKLYRLGPGVAEELAEMWADVGGTLRPFPTRRLHPESCRHCHIAHGRGSYQYPDQDRAGPCGFVPRNTAILTGWAPAYTRRHGYFPFAGP